ncbi:TetR/AcrR family transcriptional regulator [Agromyces archimandritae]|nr:TetR/AcrR family transcriptional regulator [Agromyces archimandritae]
MERTHHGSTEPTPSGTRLSAAERRRRLIDAGVAIAREEGGASVTLARVAARTGVTKPIAYRHFGTLPDLLAALHEAILDRYGQVVREALDAAGSRPRERLAAIARAYITHGLGEGAAYDAVTAARIVAGGPAEPDFVVPERLEQVFVDAFDLDGDRAAPLIVMFIGAGDGLVESVNAGVLSTELAIASLVDLFGRMLAEPGAPSPVSSSERER